MNFSRYIILLFSILVLITGTVSCTKEKKERKLPPVRSKPEFTYPGNRPITYELDKTYEYKYIEEGNEIGTASFVISRIENGNYSIYSTINFDNPDSGDRIDGESILILDQNWHFISYDREMDSVYGIDSTMDGHYSISIENSGDTITVENNTPEFEEPVVQQINIKGDENENTLSVDLEKTFLFDNNFIGMMAYICSQPVMKSGRRELISVYGVTYNAFIDLALTPKIKKEMDHLGEKVVVYEVDMKSDDSTFGNYYITPDGILIEAEEQGGFLVIELQTEI